MANADQLKALVKSHIERDDQHFYSVAMQVAAREARVGHGKLAEELREMIDAAKARASSEGTSGKLVPLARPRGELANLLTVSYPKNRLSDMVLDAEMAEQLGRIMKEQKHHSRIREHGLSPRRKLLLVGPPGTGKTMTASVLAGELGIPLFSVRLDALITKYMGETAAKLRQIFDAINDVRGVYFFDEFDAIGSQRGMDNDVGEIRRVLNSFLQMIEHDQSHSLIIAATNHVEILDYALFRRFDDVIEYRLPTTPQATKLIQSRLGKFAPKPFPLKALTTRTEGLSYAEIKRAVDESIKEAVMHDEERVKADVLARAFDERRKFSLRMNKKKAVSSHAGSTPT
ncbi:MULTISPECIES: AAA family ATPase [Stenotrophomonas]|uniref:AAA family ATPase n=1 Tax=Stenotrophomonas TaxID=40323 RepID=UPI0007B1DA40|nr:MULTISPECIES: AAA family ATPase [Stenotrophomonas]KZE50293.1 ATPase [Stenotrophomonas maltophilia]MBN5143478.1 ATP-binding protein [Stenotrophomonas maltophilia]MBP2479812.1 SpoVK/Ycf46/Vps4 family AAA+-type ATPase [Stenotrophomonas sp. PvP093]MCF3547631.1 AAA family ATPase [Stenotrophomonas maltophilia]PJK95689.1 ATPase [Stenotrophomonas maltophilia]